MNLTTQQALKRSKKLKPISLQFQIQSCQESKQSRSGKTKNEQTSQGRKLTPGRARLIPQQQCPKPRKNTNTDLLLSTQSQE